MKLTAPEIGLCSFVIRTTGEVNPTSGLPVARQFPTSNLDELEAAMSLNKKTKEHVEGITFIDGDIEFTPTEKALCLKLLGDRSFSAEDAESYFSLKAKLTE